jgi:phosphatidylglycerol:prolipoprotein diacylglycerol transferase
MFPILLEFGPITVFSLWFFIAAGFVVASLCFIHFAKRNRIRLNLLADHSVFLFFVTLGISRLAFILLHPDLFFYKFNLKSLAAIISIWDKGLSFWGASLGFFAGIFYLAKKRNESPMKLLDIVIPSIFIGMFFGNIGAFLDGINYGTPTNLPWGLTFRSANVKYISAIHPTQLYGALYVLMIGIGLANILKRMRAAGITLPGFIAELGLFFFSLFKFFEEFFRGDETMKIFSLRIPHIAAFLGIIAGGYLLYLRYTNKTGGDPGRVLKNTVRFLGRYLPKRKPSSGEIREEHRVLQNQSG